MTIKGSDFKLEHTVGYFFDLYLMRTVNKGKGDKERTEMSLEHHGIPFDEAIKLIIRNRLMDKEYDLKSYTETYKKEVSTILNEISW